MIKCIYLTACIFILTMSAACSKKSNVMLEKRVANESYELKEIAEIALEENDKQFIGVITSIQVAPNGNIYLNDIKLRTVHVYSSSGEFLRRIGRPGQGPGEFQFNMYISLSHNRLGVVEGTPLRRISFFDLNGTYEGAIRLDGEPGQRSITGRFEFSPNGERIYVEGISTNIDGEAVCENSFTFIVYDNALRPISRAGVFDPFTIAYCEQIPKKTIIATDIEGNIYTVHTMVPRVTKFSKNFRKLEMFSFYTDNWVLPFSENDPFDYMKPNKKHSRVFHMAIDKKNNLIFISHGWKDYEHSTKKDEIIHSYVTVLSPQGELLLEKKMPSGIIDVDDKGYLYWLKSNVPDHQILAKGVVIK